MDESERQVIDDLFSRLRQVERQASQRDAQAEAHTRQHMSGLPADPYDEPRQNSYYVCEFSQAIMGGKILADAHVGEKLLSRTPA
jgi:hypothetical protein